MPKPLSPALGCVWLRYGDEASQAADTAVQSVANVGVTAFNLDNIALKAVLKGAGRQASEAVSEGDETMEAEKTDEGTKDEKK